MGLRGNPWNLLGGKSEKQWVGFFSVEIMRGGSLVLVLPSGTCMIDSTWLTGIFLAYSKSGFDFSVSKASQLYIITFEMNFLIRMRWQ